MPHPERTIEDLKQSIRAINAQQESLVCTDAGQARISFGYQPIDRCLQGGLLNNALHEIRCDLSKDIGSAQGLLYALFARDTHHNKTVMWITDSATGPDSGTPNPDGLNQLGIDPMRFIFVRTAKMKDSIWATGEAATLNSLCAVVLHVRGNPNMFDLSVSRKLHLRAQQHNVPIFILRQAGEEEASSALTRWSVKPESSIPDDDFKPGIGAMRLSLTLERNRNGHTGHWLIAWNPQAKLFEHAARYPIPKNTGLPLHPSANRQDSTATMGEIVAFERAS